jgi:hypothetical protein
MIDIIATLGQSLFSFFCMLIFASILNMFFFPTFCKLNQKLSTENQALTVLFYALIAPLSAFLSVVVLTHPAIAVTVVYAHCHGTNCVPHVPAPITSSSAGAVLVTLTVIAALVVVYFMSKTVQSARRRQMYLEALSQPSKPAINQSLVHYRLIESDDPVAWCAGLFFPRVYVSTGLIKKLSNLQLHAVLAHEYGHVVRRDNLRKLLLKWASAFWLPQKRDALRLYFASQMEQLADRDSAAITGQAGLVKEIYAMFRSPTQESKGIYQHRHLSAKDPTVALIPSVFLTASVYLILVVMFVVLTLGLTITAHGLLEHL